MTSSADNLYDILNISESIILDQTNNAHHWLSLFDQTSDTAHALSYINNTVALINKFHSYFHFEQSFAYNICAYIYHAIGEKELKAKYLDKAIFQDHINDHAIRFDELITDITSVDDHISLLMSYDKNYRYEQDFLRFAIGNGHSDAQQIDEGLKALFEKDMVGSKKMLPDIDYKSHRLYLAKVILGILEGQYNDSLDLILITLNEMEAAHQRYHKFASDIYLKRAKIFASIGEAALAKNDRIKADDLFPSDKNR
jgi:hypothetical protein